MGIKKTLALFLCNALLWLMPEIAQSLTDELPKADPVESEQELSAVYGQTQVTGGEPEASPLEAPEVLSDGNNVLTQIRGAKTGRALDELLAALEKVHGIHVTLHPSVRRAEQVAEDIDDLPAEIALRLLFRGYDFFLQYGAVEQNSSHQLKRVWVFPRNEGDKQQILPERVLEAEHQPNRIGYAAELRDAMARSTEEAQSVIARALGEEEENARHDALQAAVQEGLPVSPYLLEKVLLHDQSEVMRAAAFEALALHSESETFEVGALIDLALQDPSPLVQSRALALREALDTPVDPPPPEREPMSSE